MKLLVVDDDRGITDFLRTHLPRHGFAIDVANNGSDGLSCLRMNTYDLVIFDLNLPDMGGELLVETVSKLEHVPPILMLTVVANVNSKARFLNAGADDYLVKPFRLEELVARIRALLRRSSIVTPTLLCSGDLTLNTTTQIAHRAQRALDLTRKEFALLEYLIRHKGNVVPKETLLEHVWESSANAFSFSLDTHMYNLRKKLGAPDCIKTIHSRGYMIA